MSAGPSSTPVADGIRLDTATLLVLVDAFGAGNELVRRILPRPTRDSAERLQEHVGEILQEQLRTLSMADAAILVAALATALEPMSEATKAIQLEVIRGEGRVIRLLFLAGGIVTELTIEFTGVSVLRVQTAGVVISDRVLDLAQDEFDELRCVVSEPGGVSSSLHARAARFIVQGGERPIEAPDWRAAVRRELIAGLDLIAASSGKEI